MLWRGPQHCNMPKVANAYLDSSLSVSYCLFTFHDKTVPYIFLTTAPGRAFWSLDWRLSFRSPWAQPRDEEQDLISSPDPLLADTRRPQHWWHCEFPHEPAMAQTLSGRETVAFVENWWKTRKSFQSTVSASTYEYLPPPALASTVKTQRNPYCTNILQWKADGLLETSPRDAWGDLVIPGPSWPPITTCLQGSFR